MTWVATAIVGSSLVGGYFSNKAAKAQSRAARDSQNLSKDQFDRTIELNAPFREAGLTAQNRMLTLLGLKDGEATAGGGFRGPLAPGQAPPANSDSPDFGKYARDFGMADYQADPGYSFRLAEGLKALQRTAAARGGLLSGAILKGVTRYGQDSASQEYQNAFNRYQVNRANQLQPLQSLMGAGQTATNTVGAAGQIYAGQAGEAMMGGANARGSGYVGVANAINSGLGSYLNHQQNQNYMNLLKPGGTGSPGSGSSWLSQPTYGDGLEYGGP